MTTGKRIKQYHIKMIDELGTCYFDEVITGFRNRQDKIAKWIGSVDSRRYVCINKEFRRGAMVL